MVDFSYLNSSTPFIFICTSSGTGKTQLPFSIDIPLIYLVFNEKIVRGPQNFSDLSGKPNQHIYLYYTDISQCFLSCLEKDYNSIMRSPENEEFRKNNLPKLETPDIERPLYLIGFIIEIYKNLLELRKHYKNESWIISQLRIKDLFVSPLSLLEGQTELQKLQKNNISYAENQNIFNTKELQLPTIFFLMNVLIQIHKSTRFENIYLYAELLKILEL